MATRKIKFAVDEYYHVYNRGVDKRIIFSNSEDYRYFMYLMKICNSDKNIRISKYSEGQQVGSPIVAIGLYCLMANHFHLLLKEIEPGGISKYILKLSTAYAMYFNKKYARTGVLFEGFFKATHITGDTQLKYLYSYIHLNPAKILDSEWRMNPKKSKIELRQFVEDYAYSSLKEYRDSQSVLLDMKVFPEYFLHYSDHKKELWRWLTFNDESLQGEPL